MNLKRSVFISIASVIILLFLGQAITHAKSHKEHFDKGKKAYKKKDYLEAYDQFKKALQKEPEKAKYHYNFGLAARKLKRYRDAYNAFSNAQILDPGIGFTKKKSEFRKKLAEMRAKVNPGERFTPPTPVKKKKAPKKASPLPQPEPTKQEKRKKKGLPIWLFVVGGVILLIIIFKAKGKGKGKTRPTHSHPTRGTGPSGTRQHRDEYRDGTIYDDHTGRPRTTTAGATLEDQLRAARERDREDDIYGYDRS